MGSLRELLALTIPGVEDWLGDCLRWRNLVQDEATRAGDAEVTPFDVDHGIECVGFRISRGGSAMTFGSDTRPCENVVRHAKGSKLLVHEAYGLRGDAEQAHAFGHSTAAEAGRAAREAGVGHLVLTHLRASRHQSPEELEAEAEDAFDGPVTSARDLDVLGF